MKRAPKIDTDGLRFLRPGERCGHLLMLHQTNKDGFKQRLVCSKCNGEAWEKRGDVHVCWNCEDEGLKFEDGRWVKAAV